MLLSATASAVTSGADSLGTLGVELPERASLVIAPKQTSDDVRNPVSNDDLNRKPKAISAGLTRSCRDDDARLLALSYLDSDKYVTSLLRSYTELRSWFFQSAPYLEWCEGKAWHLICYEEPRSGKTTFAARVAEDIKERRASQTDKLAVASIFLGHGEKKSGYHDAGDAPVRAMLRAILRKLLEVQIRQQRRSSTLDALPSTKGAIDSMSLQTLRDLVDQELTHFDEVFLVIDGLDLIFQEKSNEALKQEAERLAKTIANGHPLLRLISIQSRTCINESKWIRCDSKYPCHSQGMLYWQCNDCAEGDFHICHDCYQSGHRCLVKNHKMAEPYSFIELYTHPSQESLREYLGQRLLKEIGSNSTIGRELVDAQTMMVTVRDRVADNSTGSFTLAKLAMDYMSKNQSFHDVMEILDHLPKHETEHMERLFRAIFKQTSDEDCTRALAALSIAATTYEQNHDMSFGVLAEAVDVLTKHAYPTLTPTRLFTITRNLLDVTAEAVRVINSTVYVFLREKCATEFQRLRLDMAEICIQQIMSARELLPMASEDVQAAVTFSQRNPFTWYSLQNWGRFLGDDCSEKARAAAKDLIRLYQKSPALRQATFLAVNTNETGEIWSGSSGIHVLAYFGLGGLLVEMLEQDSSLNVNVRDWTTGRTPLHIACGMGHLWMAAKLLERGADASLVDKNGRTPLSEAVQHCHLDLVKVILETSASKSLNQLLNRPHRLTGGRTPLMLAINLRNKDLVTLVLQQQATNVNIQDEMGHTALHHAALTSQTALYQLLIDHEPGKSGRPPNHNLKAKHGGRTACMILLETGCLENVEDALHIVELSFEQGMDLGRRDASGRTLLHYASAQEFSSPIVTYLISKGMDVNATDDSNRTPLHTAAANGFEMVAKELIKHSADLHAMDANGFTACDTALLYHHPDELVNTLATNGTSIPSELPEERKNTILGLKLSEEPESFLVDFGPAGTSCLSPEQISRTDSFGSTLLHYAASASSASVARILLQDARLDADAVDVDGKSALHVAIELRDETENNEEEIPLAELLIEHRVAVNIIDRNGQTPLDYAMNNDHFDLAFALLKRGATIPLCASDKARLLAEAIRSSEHEAFRILLQARADIFQYTYAGRLPSQTAADEHADEEMQRLLAVEEQALLRALGGALPRKDSQQE